MNARFFPIAISLIFIFSSCATPDPITTSEGLETRNPGSEEDNAPDQISSYVIPEHHIGIREVGGIGEFFNRQTGDKFVPRGNNFIHLDPMQKKGDGGVITFSMFNPGFYDQDEIRTSMEEMHEMGYNIVRIFVESEGVDGLGGNVGLNPLYLDNLADFLNIARENEIYVIMTKQWLPISPRYGDILQKDCCSNFNGANLLHMSPAGRLAHITFFQDLINELAARQAPLEMVFSYSISNEFYFDSDQPPLSWGTGVIKSVSGREYDMSKAGDKAALMDESLIAMINQVRDSIHEIDSTALVSIGFFAPQEPNPHRVGDLRISRTYAAIWQSEADFIDLHAYPAGDLPLEKLYENYGVSNMQKIPVIMGEFGAFVPFFDSTDSAAQSMVAWQVDSCELGFDGWLTWTWDDSTVGEVFPAIAGQGQIAEWLSPKFRPDPCEIGSDLVQNLSLGAGVAVSSGSLPGEPKEYAIDGLSATQWGAGLSAPQWIEIDLGSAHSIKEFKLLIAQWPEGETVHRISVRDENGANREVHKFSQLTKTDDWLIYKPEVPLEAVRYVRVETLASPSWVAWKEIQILGN